MLEVEEPPVYADLVAVIDVPLALPRAVADREAVLVAIVCIVSVPPAPIVVT